MAAVLTPPTPAPLPSARFLDHWDVTWLLAGYVLTMLPHAERLPFWVTGAGIAAMAWRLAIAWRGWAAPPRWLLVILTIAALAATFWVQRRIWGRDAGTMLLVCMLFLKLLEMRTTRDVTVALYLGFFLVITNFLYSQSVFMALYMVACLAVFVSTMVSLSRLASKPTLGERVKPALKILAFAIPLTAVLFILFPRAVGPLWRMPDDGRTGRTGLSESMSPGTISKLIQSDEPAFIVRFDGAIPDPALMYWRGPVLSEYDGRTWQRPFGSRQPLRASKSLYPRAERPVRYVITPEPTDKPWALALDVPGEIPEGTRLAADFQVLIAPPSGEVTPTPSQRQNLEFVSYLDYQMPEPNAPVALTRNLQHKPSANPRILALGREWRERLREPQGIINEALRLYNREFTYTLEPPLLAEKDPYDDFIFNTKQGFCEHYAGSFALLMRAAGIPARVVTGYLGGELNPINRTVVVKQSDAHAWTEVYLDGSGWVRIDPTNAVAPSRIERGLADALGPIGVYSTLEANDPFGLLASARHAWSAFNYQWSQWVINYNSERQRSLLGSLGIDNIDWQTLIRLLVIFGAIAAGITVLMMFAKQVLKRPDPVERTYQALLKKLAAMGVDRAPWQGPLALAKHKQLATRPEVREALACYALLRYSGEADASLKQEFARLVSAIA